MIAVGAPLAAGDGAIIIAILFIATIVLFMSFKDDP